MLVKKISAKEFNKEDNVIRLYALKEAPVNLLKGVSIVAEWILELPFDFMELMIEVLKKRGKKFKVYPREDKIIIAVQY